MVRLPYVHLKTQLLQVCSHYLLRNPLFPRQASRPNQFCSEIQSLLPMGNKPFLEGNVRTNRLVGVKLDALSLALDGHGNNFVRETASGLCRGCLCVAVCSKLILLCSAYSVFLV